jgi:hypothetical protein
MEQIVMTALLGAAAGNAVAVVVKPINLGLFANTVWGALAGAGAGAALASLGGPQAGLLRLVAGGAGGAVLVLLLGLAKQGRAR